MDIELFSFRKRYNSLKVPTGSGTVVSVDLKAMTSIYSPTFLLSSFNDNNYYVKWGSRYYYITDVSHVRKGLIEIKCQIDLLGTYRGEILGSSAYVAFSSSTYDDRIIDTRLSTVDETTYSTTSATLLTDGTDNESNYTYILEYATDLATYGASGLLWLYPSALATIADQLNSEGFNNFLSTYLKQLNSAYDSLIGCKAVPFNWISSHTGSLKYVHLGGYDSQVLGSTITKTISYSVSIAIPWQFNDFRNSSPFTSLLMYLPAYGFVELNPNDLIGKTTITVKLVVDGVTGEGTYTVDKLFRGVTNFATPIAIGTSSNNVSGVVSAGLSIAAGAITGGGLGAAYSIPQAINGVIASQQRSFGMVGGSSGGSAIKASIESDWKKIYFISICHNTNQDPSALATTNGRPLNQVKTLSTLSGYCQTVNASVATDNENFSQSINTIMNGGFYIE